MSEQQTEEWLQSRLGKATASRCHDIIAKLKTTGGYAASRREYLGELLIERLSGRPTRRYQSDAMRHGIELEPEARREYAFRPGVDHVVEVGFVDHPTIAMSGCSPDGLVNDDGLVELKCPLPHTHLDALHGVKPPIRYITQCHWQLACTRRKWCDLVFYCPDYPRPKRLLIYHIQADPKIIAALEQEVSDFLAELDREWEFVHSDEAYEDEEQAA